MFFDTTQVADRSQRQAVEGILTDLSLTPAPVAPLSGSRGQQNLSLPVVCVADEAKLRAPRFRNFWENLSAHHRHQFTLVCLRNDSKAALEKWAADLSLRAADGSVVYVEVKLLKPGPSAKKHLNQLRNVFVELVARNEPDSIRSVDYAPIDGVLWVEFGDGLRRAFPWNELAFATTERGIRPESVRASEHRDSIVFDADRGEIDVDAAALRALGDETAGRRLAKEKEGALVQLGKRLQAAREQKGLSQEQLAERTGLPQPTISRIETGEREPKLATLEKYAKGLGRTVSDLLAGADS